MKPVKLLVTVLRAFLDFTLQDLIFLFVFVFVFYFFHFRSVASYHNQSPLRMIDEQNITTPFSI